MNITLEALKDARLVVLRAGLSAPSGSPVELEATAALVQLDSAIALEEEREARRLRSLRDRSALMDGEVTVRGTYLRGFAGDQIDPPEPEEIEELEVILRVADADFDLDRYGSTDDLKNAIEAAILAARKE